MINAIYVPLPTESDWLVLFWLRGTWSLNISFGSVRLTRMTYNGSNRSSRIEYCPEDGYVAAFVLLWWIRHHDRPLCSPKHSCTEAEQSATEYNEGIGVVDFPVEQRRNVDTVPYASNRQRQSNANFVHNAPTEESHYRKGCIESSVGLVRSIGISDAAAAEPVQSIEHAWAEEAYQRDD